MSKAADDNWGAVWSRESEMECRVALQVIASCVYDHWRDVIDRRSKTASGRWVEGIGLGDIHDIWNYMYDDMKALYTLEKLVNNHYSTRIFDSKQKEAEEDAESPEDDESGEGDENTEVPY